MCGRPKTLWHVGQGSRELNHRPFDWKASALPPHVKLFHAQQRKDTTHWVMHRVLHVCCFDLTFYMFKRLSLTYIPDWATSCIELSSWLSVSIIPKWLIMFHVHFPLLHLLHRFSLHYLDRVLFSSLSPSRGEWGWTMRGSGNESQQMMRE